MAHVVADTVVKAAIALVKGTELVGGRVFRMDSVPQSSRITYPYVAITDLPDSSIEWSADGGDRQAWREMIQADIYHKRGPVDPAIRRGLVNLFSNSTADVNNGRIRFRMVSVVIPPNSEPADVTIREVLTVSVFLPRQSL